eukprot:1160588-Pelagomonas_calceolata.AAC.2
MSCRTTASSDLAAALFVRAVAMSALRSAGTGTVLLVLEKLTGGLARRGLHMFYGTKTHLSMGRERTAHGTQESPEHGVI